MHVAGVDPAGLDRLAAQKRAEQAKQGGSLLGACECGFTSIGALGSVVLPARLLHVPACWCLLPMVLACNAAGKRPLLAIGDEDDGGAAEDDGRAGGGDAQPAAPSRTERHYRGQRIETPSHPGGVSDRVRESAADRERRQREREREGVYASTSGRERRDDRGGRDWRDDRGREGRDTRDDRRGSRERRDDRHGSGSRDRDRDRERYDRWAHHSSLAWQPAAFRGLAKGFPPCLCLSV